MKLQMSETGSLSNKLIVALSTATAIVYFFSNPKPRNYDYTFRVAANMLGGSIAFTEKPPPWLNEFVPFEGVFYSVFPLGSVVSMMPIAFFKTLGLIKEMPGAWIAATLAGAACFLLLKIASRYDVDNKKRILFSLAILFGTFTWTNLTFAGAWQLALGFALVGELGAIYFTVFDRRPLIAGVFFAMAFGNRTENLLTAPVFFYLLTRNGRDGGKRRKGEEETGSEISIITQIRNPQSAIRNLASFSAVPFVLGVATLVYNYVRFHSFTDFGYARIPGVLDEPWYRHGIFSVEYIPGQAWEMLLKLWNWQATFPYIVPDGFSSSILLTSPFLLLALRVGAKNGGLKLASWVSIAVLTIVLWMHGNSGGWQFGYRYAMVLLPWIFVLLLESSKKRVSPVEWTLCIFSLVANAYATWLFNWTEYVKQ
ncbi:MAG: hypothetical protein ACKVQW_09215 [Pyrinomonadaceae bacterium]